LYEGYVVLFGVFFVDYGEGVFGTVFPFLVCDCGFDFFGARVAVSL
jgi:hypothetical protein